MKDVDSDGDLDVLGAAQFGNKITWWESNLTGIEETWVVSKKDHSFGATIISGPLRLPKDEKSIVYSSIGRIVRPNHLTPGIYFIEINGQFVKKIVKVR